MTAGHLKRASAVRAWQEREAALCAAIDGLGRRQGSLGLPLAEPVTQPFFDRPFRVTNPDTVRLLTDAIVDPAVRQLPVGIGSVEQWCDNVDLLGHPERRAAVQALYRRLLGHGRLDRPEDPGGGRSGQCQ